MAHLLSETDAERRKRLFFESAPPDPTQQAKRAGSAHWNRSLGTVLMPQSVMPIGPHTGKLMERIAHDYLAWVQAQPWAAEWHAWHPVADYLQRFPLPESQGPQWPTHICTVSAMQACAPTQDWTYPEHALLRCHHDVYLHEDKYHTFALGALCLRPTWFDPKLQAYRLTQPKRHRAIQCGAGELAPDPRQRERPRYQRQNDDGTQQCTKHCYATKAAADLVAADRMKSRRNRPAMLRSYHCPDCGFHHLTSTPL